MIGEGSTQNTPETNRYWHRKIKGVDKKFQVGDPAKQLASSALEYSPVDPQQERYEAVDALTKTYFEEDTEPALNAHFVKVLAKNVHRPEDQVVIACKIMLQYNHTARDVEALPPRLGTAEFLRRRTKHYGQLIVEEQFALKQLTDARAETILAMRRILSQEATVRAIHNRCVASGARILLRQSGVASPTVRIAAF